MHECFQVKDQRRALRFVLDDYTSSYELLLEKSGKPNSRKSFLCVEVYKTLNGLSPCFMQELFKLRKTNRNIRNKCKSNYLDIPVVHQVTYNRKSPRSFGPKIGTLYHTTAENSWNLIVEMVCSCNWVVCSLKNSS